MSNYHGLSESMLHQPVGGYVLIKPSFTLGRPRVWPAMRQEDNMSQSWDSTTARASAPGCPTKPEPDMRRDHSKMREGRIDAQPYGCRSWPLSMRLMSLVPPQKRKSFLHGMLTT
ncbi:hypothetical protein N7533_010444 [Penicillium manginii]|uniref:uncharacterized protein n=1 Tax=Penicillium manginii TaxID=203109 RepID=UPI002547CFD5|nr:uncharacterized protein N7533_010444 [Penicillium manginii]KAJ5743342.1 hypothetical protein N7533_010444 [Penicillium manginii]